MKSRNKLQNNEAGAGLVEYALLVALISVISIVGIDTLGDNTARKYTDLASKLDDIGAVADSGGCGDLPADQCAPPPEPPPGG